MFRFNYDVFKILQNGFMNGFVFGSAIGIPIMTLILLIYWIF